MSTRRIGDPHDPDTFTVTLATSNAAFRTHDPDNEDGDPFAVVDPYAVADLLDTVAARLRDGHHSGDLRDVNGNHVGEWRLG